MRYTDKSVTQDRPAALNETRRPFAANTHSGLKRDHNEDCFGAEPDLGLWLVADGVGGHSCGEVASDIVCNTIRDQVAGGKRLMDAIAASHAAVLAAIAERENAHGMGSTVVAALLDGDRYELCWVGDSRAYLWNGQLQQLTVDHNRVGELLANQVISPEQASSHPERHVLTQSLGVSDSMPLHPGRLTGTLGDSEQLLLCSDGLTDEISDSLIAYLLAGHDTPRAQVDALISAALDAGGSDNITALVIGSRTPQPATGEASDLETTRNSRRSASGGKPNDGRFPLKALLLLSALALLAVWVLV